MSLVVLGLHHRSAPLELLERTTVAADRLPKVLADVVGRDDVREAVVLSTCNRTEVYASVERFHPGVGDLRDALSELAFVAPEDLTDHVYTYHDTAAVAHLFTVAAGLDSALLGESEILGQVRRAWEVAAAEGASGTALNQLVRHAVEVGKRVRHETGIGRRLTSLSSAAVALAGERLGGLEGRRAVVVGAGAMGHRIATVAASRGAEVVVANRTVDRARAVAAAVGGSAVGLLSLPSALAEADVVLTSTGSSTPLIERADLEAVVAGRRSPLLVVDVAVPRDVDPAVSSLPGVTLLDMDDLRASVDAGLAARRREVGRARDLIDDEVARYRDAATARSAAPLVVTLRRRAEELRAAEVDRLGRNLAPAEREALEALSRSVVAKLLHEPTVRLKEAGGTVRGERLAEAVRDLFDLDDD
jgi:glutamyl-tRNA reductase